MRVKFYHIFRLGVWLAFMAGPAGLQAALTPEELYQKALPSVMTLEVENQQGEKFVGSAVLALADDAALTTWHVVADARSVWAVFADGQRVKVTGCIDHDSVRDLALLKLEKRLPHRQAALCRELQPVAARAYVIGAPKGYDFSISDGLISQIRSVDGLLQYQLSCPISPGNSGSPVLNRRGEVIGLASWTKADAQNINFAIPAGEFSHLHVLARPSTWDQLNPAVRLEPSGGIVNARQVTAPVSAAGTMAGGYAAFQQRLRDSAGQSVTIVVQDSGRTNIFKFIVE